VSCDGDEHLTKPQSCGLHGSLTTDCASRSGSTYRSREDDERLDGWRRWRGEAEVAEDVGVVPRPANSELDQADVLLFWKRMVPAPLKSSDSRGRPRKAES